MKRRCVKFGHKKKKKKFRPYTLTFHSLKLRVSVRYMTDGRTDLKTGDVIFTPVILLKFLYVDIPIMNNFYKLLLEFSNDNK